MKKYMICGALCALLTACGERPLSTDTLFCGDSEIYLKVFPDYIDTIIDGQRVRMNQTVSASGARYESTDPALEGVVLWNKGRDWMLIPSDAEMPIICTLKSRECPPENVPTPKLP